jgi:hypothetical protein
MPGLTQSAISRLAAAAVALALSGLPQLVEGTEPHEGHRCQCPVRKGVHECDCPLCHQEAARLGTGAAADPSLPPCHRALAARAQAKAGEQAQRQAATVPCFSSTCGTSEHKLLPVPAAERFMAPAGWVLLVVEEVSDVKATQALPWSLHREPETPPPRGA